MRLRNRSEQMPEDPEDTEERAYLEGLTHTRMFAEHQLLAEAFFTRTRETMLAILAAKGEFLANIYNAIESDLVTPEDFAVRPYKTKNMLYVIIRPPKPENPLECSLIILGTDTKGNHPVYYTIERTEDGGFYFCVKQSKDEHVILAIECGDTLEEHLKAVIEYLNR